MLDLKVIEADRAARVAHWRELGVYGDYTYPQALAEGAARFGATRLVVHSQTRPADVTVAEAHGRSEHLASAFHDLGLRPGDRIAVMLPTWYDTILAYVAALKLGLVVVPIVAIYGPREIGFIVRQTEAKALVLPDRFRGHDYLERVSQAGDLPSLKHLMVVGENVPPGAIAWDRLLDHPGTDYPRDTARGDDICVIIYTSGTTSDPKGVKHSHNTQLCDANAARVAAAQDPGFSSASASAGDGPTLGVFPAGHIAGWLAMLRPFLQGGSVVFMDQWVPEEAARLIEKYGCAAASGTPIFLSSLRKAAEAIGADISSMKRFQLGASAVTPENIRWTDQLGFPSGRIYGSTEHPVVSAGLNESFEKRAYTDGKVSPRVEVRILDDEDHDLAVGEAGEIAVRGPRLFMGYVDAELDKACFLPGGWFKTGDIGRLDAEGYLTITDRKKDIIIRGGENISSKEVEDVLSAMPGVVESAVTSMPDREMGERVCAYLVLHEGAQITLADVQAFFREQGVTRQKTPERLIVVDDLPRTPSGKVKKNELRDQLRKEAREDA